jgi:hypothetical protein
VRPLPRLAQAYREAKAGEAQRLGWSLERYCGFPQQLTAASSASKRKVLDCSRRAGKSKTIEAILTEAIQAPPFTNVFYITNTAKAARRIIWGGLKQLNQQHGLGGVPNETEAYLAFPSLGPDVHIYTAGAKDAGVIESLRGTPSKLYVVDEMQSMPERVRLPLMRDVISPALMDYGGALVVAGTPGAVPSGYFHDVCQGALAKRWEQHRWTWRENLKLPAFALGRTVEQIEADILDEHGWTRDHPTFLREYCGIWATDLEVLVFKWDAGKNGLDVVPELGPEPQYVMGVDLGFEDADAIVVLGWSAASRDVYLVEEDVTPRQGLTALGDKVQRLWAKYKPSDTWVDSGGLGRKIIDELQNRWRIPCEAAEKTRKLEHIELLNDALRTGRFKALKTSRFAEDCGLEQWDVDARAKGVLKVSDGYHSDVTDAVLYAYRCTMGYMQNPPPPLSDGPNEAQLQERQARTEARLASLATRNQKRGARGLL